MISWRINRIRRYRAAALRTLRDKVHGLLVAKPLRDRTAASRWLQNSLRRVPAVRTWIEEVHDNARTIAEAAAQRGLLVRTSSTRRSADSLACAVAAHNAGVPDVDGASLANADAPERVVAARESAVPELLAQCHPPTVRTFVS